MFDFQDAELPELTPLKNSFVFDEVENQLRNLFLKVFNDTIAADYFDTNVSGMAHLGSIGLVKRKVNTDGLVLLPTASEDASTRYIYRAWKSLNKQGRGLYFLRTYLQAIFPGQWSIDQQSQDKAFSYPTKLSNRLASGNVVANNFLTSRINIKIAAAQDMPDISGIPKIIAAIIPARFVPKILITLFADSKMRFSANGNISMTMRAISNVTAPDISFGDISTKIAAKGNISMTLRAKSIIRR